MRSWYTPDGEILLEGRPLDGEAHEYLLLDAAGTLIEAEVSPRHDQRLTLLGVDESVLAAAHQHWDETADRAAAADALLAAATRGLVTAFSSYPVKEVIEGCPCCRGPVRVAQQHDLFSLALSLGNTVGTVDDVKSLLPLLLTRLVESAELDEHIVVGKCLGWQAWPLGERAAVDRYLHAVWRALLARYPARTGSLTDAAGFLRAVAPLYQERIVVFPQQWRAINPPAADRHLADLVHAWVFGGDLPAPVVAWLRRPVVRGYLFLAYIRQRDAPWSGELAEAYDFLEAA